MFSASPRLCVELSNNPAHSPEQEVLTAAADWLDAGHGVYLVTVARSWGSSPRPPGSLPGGARASDGACAGSVSGGCVEDDLSARLAAHGATMALPRVESYGVTAEQTAALRPAVRRAARSGGRAHRGQRRRCDGDPRRVRRAATAGAASVPGAPARPACMPPRGPRTSSFDGDNLAQVFGPAWRLILIGAGQLSRLTGADGTGARLRSDRMRSARGLRPAVAGGGYAARYPLAG
ncbi:MAG: XdhC family protein [Chromatiales bacterium]|nr:XdhC family protein [Chromatiales bacterium]